MSTLGLRWLERQRYVATDSWGNEVAVDGRLDSLTGAKPSDLLPIALAACVAYTLVDVLSKRRQRLDSLDATIDVEQDPEPPWKFRRIDIRFVLTGDIDEAKASKTLQMAHEKYCSVSASLDPGVKTSYSVEVRAR